MPLVIRLGDTSSHGGAVVGSCTKYRAEGALIARLGDAFECPIHGTTAIAEGSSKYSCEGAPITRQGDRTRCGASLISGASKYLID